MARYGGEEFVVLLPGANAEVAHKVAERCQRLIQKKSIVHARLAFNRRVTVSIGAGTAVPDEAALHTDFLNAVDQELYAAKHHGRNRIEHVAATSRERRARNHQARRRALRALRPPVPHPA